MDAENRTLRKKKRGMKTLKDFASGTPTFRRGCRF